MKRLIALIMIIALLCSGCFMFGQTEEGSSLSDKLSGLERDEQLETDMADGPEESDAAKAPVNTSEDITGSFEQMESAIELLCNVVTPENRDGNGEFGLSPDMEEVERHRRMNPENETMPDDYIYSTKWMGTDQDVSADWKTSIYFRDTYIAYECRYSVDGMEYRDVVNAIGSAQAFSFFSYYCFEDEPYSSDSYWVEGVGIVDDSPEFKSLCLEKLEGEEDFVCIYSIDSPRQSDSLSLRIDVDVDEVNVNVWRFEGETFLDFTYVKYMETASESEPSASESSAAEDKPPALYTEPDGSPTAMDMVRLGTYENDDVFGVGLVWSVTFYNDYTFEFSYDHEEGTEYYTGNWHTEDNGGELRVILNITNAAPFTISLDVDGGKYVYVDDYEFWPDVVVLPFVG